MLVVDNVLSNRMFSNIKNCVYNNNVAWFFTNTAHPKSFSEKSIGIFSSSFYHMVYENNTILSSMYDIVYSTFLCICDQQNINLEKLLRIRVGLIPPKEKTYQDLPHVDALVPHKVGLLYLSNSDGPTTIFKEKFNYGKKFPYDYYVEDLCQKVTLDKKIECVENRFVVFDGSLYHSSNSPTNTSRRVVITYNFTTHNNS